MKSFPGPDFTIALHDDAISQPEQLATRRVFALASSTSVDIKIRGLGGHGSKPDATKDPIVVGCAGGDGVTDDRQP